MRPLLSSALVAAVAMALLPAMPQPAQAKTGVLRCQMPDGTSVYTNKACSALGATSKPLPADVLGRIARDQRRELRRVAEQTGVDIGTLDLENDGIMDATAMPAARRPMAGGCATTPQQLAMDLKGAVALGDVNRIAESFDWAGMGNEQAQRIMARLEQIARRPVRDTEYFDASIGDGLVFADASNDAFDGAAGMLQVTFDAGNGDSIVDYEVRRDEGCYFLRY